MLVIIVVASLAVSTMPMCGVGGGGGGDGVGSHRRLRSWPYPRLALTAAQRGYGSYNSDEVHLMSVMMLPNRLINMLLSLWTCT